jgi:hypothetical protein
MRLSLLLLPFFWKIESSYEFNEVQVKWSEVRTDELWHDQVDDDVDVDDDDQVDDDKMICMTYNIRLCNIYSIYNADRSIRSSWGMRQHELVKYILYIIFVMVIIIAADAVDKIWYD